MATVYEEAVRHMAEKKYGSTVVMERGHVVGVFTTTDALRVFFHTENCLFVRKQLRDKLADAIMSHGVQLPDLFEALPPEEAHREFQRELATIRLLCLKLLEAQRLVA